MSTVLAPDFQIDSAQQLAAYLAQAGSWQEIEGLTRDYAQFKIEAWQLLTTDQQNHILKLKEFKDLEVAQKFPLGCTVQRRNDPEKKQGQVIDYMSLYGIDYVMFTVDGFTDWCQGTALKRIYTEKKS